MIANSHSFPDSEPQPLTRSIDVFDILKLHWWKILFGSLMGVAAAVCYCLATMPIHESKTEILILSKEAGLASHTRHSSENSVGFNNAMQSEMLVTHLHILRSSAIARRAIEMNHLAELDSIRNELSPSVLAEGDENSICRAVDSYIRGNLIVQRAGSAETKGAQVMHVSFRHTSAEDGALVLSSIVAAYEEFVNEIVHRIGGEAISLIRKERDDLEAQVQQRDRQYADFVQHSPLQAQFGETVNPHAIRVAELETELSRLQIEETNTRSRLALVEKVVQQTEVEFDELSMIDSSDVPRLNLLIEVDRNSPTEPVAAEYQRMRELESERASLTLRLGANHPKVKELRSRMDEFTTNVSDGMSSLEAIKTDDGINPRRLASRYAELLRSDLLDYQRSEEALNEQIVKEMEAASVLVQTELQQRRYYRELERAESEYNVVLDRIGQLNLLSNYAGFANAVLTPVEPGKKVWPKVPLLVFAGGLLGSLLGVCFGLVIEVFDRSYRSPADVEDTLSVPVLGHLPAIRKQQKLAGSDADPTVCALHRPNSIESEAIRKLRGSLFYKTNHVDRPIIQVTSPGQGEGKSTLATNLAVSTAQSRRRVLLVDCDFRSRRSAILLGEQFDVGLADVLTGKADVEEAVHSTSVPGLSMVPCGSETECAAEWFTMEEFRQFIRQVSEGFDFVFIDSPAVLDFSDSMAIADAADFVIMTFGLSPKTRSKSQEALAHLQSHGSTVLGVVVNEFGKSSPYTSGRLLRRMELASH